jgi:peptidoglycan hydrolase CwlO-like protein
VGIGTRLKKTRTNNRAYFLAFCAFPIIILLVTLLLISSAAANPSDELSNANQQVSDAQVQSQELDNEYNSALQDLVAVDSEVGRYDGEITAVNDQLSGLGASIEAAKAQLTEVQSNLLDRQEILEKRIRSTYKSDDMGYLEVVMGAGDFSDFLNRIDMINEIAEDDRRLIDSIKDTKQQIETDLADLEQKQAEQESLLTELNSAQQNLLDAQAEQQSVVTSIQTQRELNEEELIQLQSQAASIEASMAQAQTEAVASNGGDYSPPPAGGTTLTMTATSYCMEGTTATGMPVGQGVIAVDPSVIPLGTKVYVSGYGDAIAADTGGAIVGNIIDVWLPCSDAYAWGSRTVTVTIY